MKQFKVGSISDKPNSFGLYGHIMIAADGEAWEVGRHKAGTGRIPWVKNDTITVNYAENDRLMWEEHGVEIPRKLPNAPLGVVKEIWNSHPIRQGDLANNPNQAGTLGRA